MIFFSKQSLIPALIFGCSIYSIMSATVDPETNPVDWEISTPVPGESWVSLASNQGVTVLGSLSGTIYYSTDQIHWNRAERYGSAPMWNCISTRSGFIGAADSYVLTSDNGMEWKSFPADHLGIQQVSPSEYELNWLAIEWLYTELFSLKGSDPSQMDISQLRYSFTNPSNTNSAITHLHEFHSIHGKFVMGVGEAEYRETIEGSTSNSNSYLQGWVARFPDTFNQPEQSQNPEPFQFLPGPIYSLAYNDDVYVITGAELEPLVVNASTAFVGPDRQVISGIMYRSENSEDWTAVEIEGMPAFYEIHYRNQRFVAVGKEGWIWSSSDGLSWDTQTRIEEESAFQALHYDDAGTWMAAGMDGTFATSTVLHHPTGTPTVTIKTEGVAVEGDPAQKATVFWESDIPLNSQQNPILEYSSITDKAVVSPAAEANGLIQFTAIYDQDIEGEQFVDVIIKSDSEDYRIGLPYKARISILDAATDRWRERFFANPRVSPSSDSYDFDQDGFSNLLERFFGTDPLIPTSADDLKIYWSQQNGTHVLEAKVSEDIRDMNVRLEVSQDGSEWTELPVAHQDGESLPAESSEGEIRKTIYWQISDQGLEEGLIRLSAERIQ